MKTAVFPAGLFTEVSQAAVLRVLFLVHPYPRVKIQWKKKRAIKFFSNRNTKPREEGLRSFWARRLPHFISVDI